MGDYARHIRRGTLKIVEFDFIFIDALHTEEFSKQYCQDILRPQTREVIVAIHDIVADANGGGRESAEVYKYMAFADNLKNVFTMSKFLLPSINYPLKDGMEKINEIRAANQIVKPCHPPELCKLATHDYLYFENGDSPTIFFTLNI
jgi:predicted O-methyltransferase YrrM